VLAIAGKLKDGGFDYGENGQILKKERKKIAAAR
jgi:hypothetical protein